MKRIEKTLILLSLCLALAGCGVQMENENVSEQIVEQTESVQQSVYLKDTEKVTVTTESEEEVIKEGQKVDCQTTNIGIHTIAHKKDGFYINGEKIHHTISPKLGERCRTNKSIYYTLDFHVTPHLLRHTYITNLIHEGVDPKTVQYLAGHENSKVTMDIYAKVKYNKPWELAPVINQVFSINSEKESA